MTMRQFSGSGLTRRSLLAGLAAGSLARPALGQSAVLNGEAQGLVPDAAADQSAPLQTAINTAAGLGKPLFLPGGTYRAAGLTLPSGLKLEGVPGRTIIFNTGTGILLGGEGQSDITLDGVTFDGGGLPFDLENGAVVAMRNCRGVSIDSCTVTNSAGHGLYLEACSGRVAQNTISEATLTGLHLQDSAGMLATGNTITDCGNGGIRVWRFASGRDGSIVTANRIAHIGSDWGDGQNGNGVNVFQADEVIVSGNHISDCHFSAVRANSTNDTIISGNQCLNSGEVAIFSEFAFTGSIIADNLIDTAATGISITNFNDGGRLAACTGNIVRNIQPLSLYNPDTRPVGIYAEADSVVANNVVDACPGVGILAGWGPYLRNVLVSANTIRDIELGIGVSVAEGAGAAYITSNLISGARMAALAGLKWAEPATLDLARDAADYPNVSLSGNVVEG
jgi:uncharacterized secreted repeat protein (TIGR03808 family)